MALTDSQCRTATPREKAYKLSDGEGLHLLVQPNGTKLWRLAYRIGGKERTLSIGKYPAVSIKQAREDRTVARYKISQGIDPKGAPQAPAILTRADGATFRQVAEQWYAVFRRSCSAKHAGLVWGRLEADALALDFGAMPVAAIEAPDIIGVLKRVEQRGALEMVRRLRQKISEILTFAVASGLRTTNPALELHRVVAPPKKSSNYAMILPQDMGRECPIFCV